MFKIKPLPYSKFTIDLDLDEEEVLSKLAPEIDGSWMNLSTWTNGKAWRSGGNFSGELSGNNFKILRHVENRNSFVPVFVGRIEKKTDGTRIIVKARMIMLTNIFCLIFQSFALSQIIHGAISSNGEGLIIGVSIFIFGWLLMCGGFWSEYPKSVEVLNGVFE